MTDYVSLDLLLAEADIERDINNGTVNPENIIVLALNRKDVSFTEYPMKIDINKNPTVYAVVSPQRGEFATINWRVPLLHNGLLYRIFIALKMLIGSIGIYPFKKIWQRTVPEGWRNEEDTSDLPGFRT